MIDASMTSPLVKPSPPGPRSIVRSSDVAELARIFEDGVNVVVLERDPSRDVEEAATALVARAGFERKVVMSVAQPELAALDVARPLAEDIAFWAGVLADLTGAELIGVRLARCDQAMCPRFHVDRVLVRICLTYVGPGTEYLPDVHADRAFLGFAGGESDTTSKLVHDHSEIVRAPTGAVVVLKGEAWPDNLGRGAIHRSPAIGPDTPRLVLTLDALG